MVHSNLSRRRLAWLKEERENAAHTLHLIKVDGWRFEAAGQSEPLNDVTDDRREELERRMAQIKGLEQDEYSFLAAQLDDEALLAAYDRLREEPSTTEGNMLLAEIQRRGLDEPEATARQADERKKFAARRDHAWQQSILRALNAKRFGEI